MSVAAASALHYRFGSFELIPSERLLIVDGAACAITPKAFDVLQTLIERAGHLVTKNDLLDAVWPQAAVEENNLQVQISALRRILGRGAIATVPGRGYRFMLELQGAEARDRAADAASPAAAPAAELTSNVPALATPLIGRDDDVAALTHLLQTLRLVTITGPGGIGKTRLAQTVALAVASAGRNRFHHGAVWVELAAVSDPALVANSIAAAARVTAGHGSDPVAGLATALRPLSLLLVIDNAEHVSDAVRGIVQAVLDAAPNVTLLVTSQAPLKAAHERVYRLASLQVPDTPVDEREAREFGAVALFCERAAAADRRFELASGTVATVVEICRKLDGVALAIELAAARVPLLGVSGVAEHLDQRFQLLVSGDRAAPSRQQTLLAALDWSHGLLTKQQKVVFRRLAVFTGSFSLEAARTVVADDRIDEWTVVDVIGELIDHSLVVATGGDNPRYVLLETGRSYAQMRLAEVGEEARFRAKHAEAMQVLFDCASDDRWLLSDAAFRSRYEPELDNLRAAIDWSSDHQPALAVSLVAASAHLLLLVSSLVEGRRLSDLVLDHVSSDVAPSLAARYWNSRAAVFADRPDKVSRTAALRARELSRDSDDHRETYIALHHLAHSQRAREQKASAALAEMRLLEHPGWPPRLLLLRRAGEVMVSKAGGRLDEARRLLEEQTQLAIATGADDLVSSFLYQLAELSLASGDVDAALMAGRELVSRFRSRRNLRRLSAAYAVYLNAAVLGSSIEEARAAAEEFIAVDHLLGWSYLHRALDALALLAALEDRVAAAALLAGYADAAHAEQTNFRTREPGVEVTRVRVREILVGRIGAESLEAAIEAGARLNPEQACTVALAREELLHATGRALSNPRTASAFRKPEKRLNSRRPNRNPWTTRKPGSS
ncbi:MAG: helix-turn-helix transcriptional regulator [Burkholderiaceae bacterium]|nr:helix-turn-helix transcriptional regulator [Burkholderiaceae bacterium]